MSWTTELLESNEFKVKHTDEVKTVLEKLGFKIQKCEDNRVCFYDEENLYFDEDAEVVLSLKPITDEETGKISNIIGVSSECCIDSVDISELEEDTYMVQPIIEYLQDELADEQQYITITTAGFEGRMSGNYNPFGDIMFITKSHIKSASLWAMEQQFKRECGLIESEVQ